VLLEQNGLSIKDVKIEVIGTEAIVPALVNKRVDAICFSMLRTFELKSQGIAVDEFRSDAFLPSFGNVLVVGKNFLDQNKPQIQKFVRALNKSLQYVSKPENIKEATKITIDKYTPTYKDQADYVASIMTSVYAGYLWTSEDTQKNGFGYGNVDRWQQTVNIMQKFGIITKPVNAKDFVIPISSNNHT